MTHSELKDNIISLNAASIIAFIETHKNEIRLFFLQTEASQDVTTSIEKILLKISQLTLSEAEKSTIQIQSFITHLAFYFKKSKNRPFADTCFNLLNDSVFKKRIGAWLHYKRYQNYQEHITQFKRYIEKLSDARYDGETDYSFELLSDLHEYHSFAFEKLPPTYKERLDDLFYDEILMEEFPLLEEFSSQRIGLMPTLDIQEYNKKEYKPSDFVTEIFANNFLNYLRQNSTGFPDFILGYSTDTIINNIIKKGQANFDEAYDDGKLSSTDIVRLYCYFNMRMHFFTSLSIFERSQIFEKYYTSSGNIKFIDIGCGPATSGLALVDHIYNMTNIPVLFDYYGVDSSIKMLERASAIMTNRIFDDSSYCNFFSSVTEIDLQTFSNSSCIIINACYLFASDTLDLSELTTFIDILKQTYPFKPKYIFFQNPANNSLNKNYFKFKHLISTDEDDIDFSQIEFIYYHTQQNPYYPAKKRSVYFEIVKF